MRCLLFSIIGLFAIECQASIIRISVNKPNVSYCLGWENEWKPVIDGEFEYDCSKENKGWFLLRDNNPPVVNGETFPVTIHNRKGPFAVNDYQFIGDTSVEFGYIVPSNSDTIQYFTYTNSNGPIEVPVNALIYRLPETNSLILAVIGMAGIIICRRSNNG